MGTLNDEAYGSNSRNNGMEHHANANSEDDHSSINTSNIIDDGDVGGDQQQHNPHHNSGSLSNQQSASSSSSWTRVDTAATLHDPSSPPPPSSSTSIDDEEALRRMKDESSRLSNTARANRISTMDPHANAANSSSNAKDPKSRYFKKQTSADSNSNAADSSSLSSQRRAARLHKPSLSSTDQLSPLAPPRRGDAASVSSSASRSEGTSQAAPVSSSSSASSSKVFGRTTRGRRHKGADEDDDSGIDRVDDDYGPLPPPAASGVRLYGTRDSGVSAYAPTPGAPYDNQSDVDPAPLQPAVSARTRKGAASAPHVSQNSIDEERPGAFRIPGRPAAPPGSPATFGGLDPHRSDSSNRDMNSSSHDAMKPLNVSDDPNAAADQPQSSLLEADLVPQAVDTAGEGLEEAVRQQIQEQAEEDVRKKFEQNTILAESKDPAAEAAAREEREALAKRRHHIKIAILIVLMVGIIGIVVGVLVSRSNNDNDKSNQSVNKDTVTNRPTPAPTSLAPTPLPPLAGDIEDVDTCFGAFNLTGYLYDPSKLGTPLNGTTSQANEDRFLGTCGAVDDLGRGVWYRMPHDAIASFAPPTSVSTDGETPKNSRWLASTCHDLTGYDSQISVYRGECKEGSSPRLQCVAGNDQSGTGCGDSSRVGFVAEPDFDYYVYVHGFRDAIGLFQLSVEPLVDNDVCENAFHVNRSVVDNSIGEFFGTIDETDLSGLTTIFGTTKGATLDTGIPRTCSFTSNTAPGVWYTIEGTGDSIVAYIESKETTDFDAQWTVFSGDSCSNLVCDRAGLQDEIAFNSIEGEIYYLLIHGLGSQQGDFTLLFGLNKPYRLEPWEPICEFGIDVPVGDTWTHNLASYDNIDPVSCGNGIFADGPAAWIFTTGTGAVLRATTCGECSADTFAEISIFEGPSCSELKCVGGSAPDSKCGADMKGASAVSWVSEKDAPYYILVHGDIKNAGAFQITIDETEIESSDFCSNAEVLGGDGSEVLGTFDSATAESDSIPKCETFNDSWAGVWYSVTGTGQPLSASSCSSNSDEEISLSLYTGDCDALVCESVMVTPCGSKSSISWLSQVGQQYFLLVQSSVSQSTSTPSGFRRAMEDAAFANETAPPQSVDPRMYFKVVVEPVVYNDVCANSIGPLTTDTSIELGSTLSATPDLGTTCSAEGDVVDDNQGRGVWYSTIGTGRKLTATTTTGYTNFAASLSVFSDDCKVCVALADVQIDEGSGTYSVSWISTPDEIYNIVVASVKSNEVGNFGLSIAEENDICISAKTVAAGQSIQSPADIGQYATLDRFVPACTWQGIQATGIWYELEAMSEDTDVTATVIHAPRQFPMAIELYTGTCSSLQCAEVASYSESQIGSKMSWDAKANERYLILVHGALLGEYEFAIYRDGEHCTSATIPAFDQNELSISTAGYATSDDNACESGKSAPGHWFQFDGTGKRITVSFSCGISPVRMAVMTGSCGELQCFTLAIPETCDRTSSIVWQTEIGTRYTVFVYGDDADVDAEFTMSFVEDPHDTCDTSQSLQGAIEADFIASDSVPIVLLNQERAFECGSANVVGTNGAWYMIRGTGGLMHAGTCFSETEADTQITVYRGPCNALECVSGNNDLADFLTGVGFALRNRHSSLRNFCDDKVGWYPKASSVSWTSEEGELYYLLVQGARNSTGNFALQVTEDPVEANDKCEDSLDLLVGEDEFELISTRHATVDDGAQICDDRYEQRSSSRGLWYSFVGTGKEMFLSTCSPPDQSFFVDFAANIDVYTGSCGSLTCTPTLDYRVCPSDASNGRIITVMTQLDAVYHVRISGDNDQDYGNFNLALLENNDFCIAAPLFRFDVDSDAGVTYMIGSTVDATVEDSILCDAPGKNITEAESQPGVWYSVTGGGKNLVASTCHSDSSVNASIHVYQKRCRQSLCIEPLSTSACSSGETVTWFAESGLDYLLLVKSDPGQFGLSVNNERTFSELETCSLAKPVLPIGTLESQQALTDFPTSDASACNFSDSVVGAWYSLEGTGRRVEVRGTCFNHPTTISVLVGDCESEQTCVATSDYSADFCFEVMGTEFDTQAGQTYYVLVHSDTDSYDGGFDIFFDEFLNDECWKSAGPHTMELASTDDLVFKEIVSNDLSTRIDFEECGFAVNAGYGMWYTVIGNGNVFEASTCNPGTDFDTQISVLTGSCFNPVCVAGNNDAQLFVDGSSSCSFQNDDLAFLYSTVSWATEPGVEYNIFVHSGPPGSNIPFGSFELTISQQGILFRQ